MTFRRSIRTVVVVVLVGLAQLGFTPAARAADLPSSPIDPTYTIDPHDTDPQILDTPTPPGPRGNHLVFLAPEDTSPVGRLLVFLPTGGVNNKPSEFTNLGAEASRLGYHTILLAYRNEAPIAAPPTAVPPALPGCGPGELPASSAPDCAIKMRMELLEGASAEWDSPLVDVDRANGIENRLNKLLQYLKTTQPEDGWAEFLDSNGEPKWSETVIAGSSLGAGQAAIIAEQHEVYRAALLHGWVDARHGWVKRGATLSNRYFTLIHQRENFFGRTCYAYRELGLAPSCPLADFPVLPAQSCPADFPDLPANPLWIENRQPPFGTPLHVFSLEPGSFQAMGDWCHQSTSRDGWIARDADGTPSDDLVDAWRSVLGDSDADTRLDEADNCPQVATADGNQIDVDLDGIGDVCDLTPRGTTPPTIVVPSPITVDATGPTGTTVSYIATATDDIDPDPTVLCSPSTGSLFAIGGITVLCHATDAGGNTANASFLVTVLGAKEQMSNLIREVIDSSRLPAAVKAQLIASLQSLVAGFDADNALQRKAACLRLKVFASVVRYLAPTAQAAEWTADANRIRAVLGC